MGKLKGKVALITGGARGMGAEHVRTFIKEGAKVYFTDILEKEGRAFAEELGESASYIYQDVTSEDDWKNVMKEIEENDGKLDILVNNAGITFYKMLGDMTLEEYMHVININQVSVFLGMTYALPLLKKGNNSSVINISSITGFKGSRAGSAYSSSKFAVRGLTQSAALEFAPYNIRVNSIHPGAVETPMLVQEDTKDSVAKFAKTIPLGRIAKPEEVTSFVLYLAGDESTYSTAGEYVIDGGALVK